MTNQPAKSTAGTPNDSIKFDEITPTNAKMELMMSEDVPNQRNLSNTRSDSYRPPNQWNQIAENDSLLTQTSVDTSSPAWDTKYTYSNPIPETYINEIGGNDDRPETVGDPNWEPNIATPPFPDYISGHSTIGGSAAPVFTSSLNNNYFVENSTSRIFEEGIFVAPQLDI
jgi:hypothetical protein